VLADILVLIFTPIVSLIGIVLNILIVYVVKHKKNQKDLKEKQYKYMALNSVCAICLLVIQVFGLMTECQEPFGLYCSQIHKFAPIQYFKIIFGEFFSYTFQLMSNFTYIAFALNRLSLIGDKDKQGRITMCVSKMAIKFFIILSAILSVLLSLVKCFRFAVNSYVANHDYPYAFQNDPFHNPSDEIIGLIFITNGIVDFINYILIILINLIVDVLLALKLRQTLREKREKFNSTEAKEKEDAEAVTRLVHMAIFYALTNLVFKIPNAITPLNDFVIISIIKNNRISFFEKINIRTFDFFYYSKYICSVTKICLVFRKWANLFYLLSFSFNIFFFYHFDKNFKSAYDVVCGFGNKLKHPTSSMNNK
jgi:hypothetical protein